MPPVPPDPTPVPATPVAPVADPAPAPAPVAAPVDVPVAPVAAPVAVVAAPVATEAPAAPVATAETQTLVVEPVAVAGVPVTVDPSDPFVMAVAWAITYAVKTYAAEKYAKVRTALPLIALFVAVLVRTLFDLGQGHALSADTLLRAIAAAGVAVFAHSQVRELSKPKKVRHDAVVVPVEPPPPVGESV